MYAFLLSMTEYVREDTVAKINVLVAPNNPGGGVSCHVFYQTHRGSVAMVTNIGPCVIVS